MTNVREIAFDALLSIDKDQSNISNTFTKDILDKYAYLDKRDRSFLARLIEGTIERMITIDYVLDLYSKVPVRKMKAPVRSLVRMGLYQLLYMDSVPESAAVNETVKLARKRGLNNLSGFINGLLRNIARNKEKIVFPDKDKEPVRFYSIFYSCPEWIVKMLIEENGRENAVALMENSMSTRPLTARVNVSKCSPKELLDNNADIMTASSILPYAVGLHNIDNLSAIEAFNNGLFSVQDISSMLVSHIADIASSDYVIDVCAAPGGKSCHCADMAVEGHVISCDVSEDKIVRIQENIDRCGFDNIETCLWDATVRRDDFLDRADVLIADVPCSGLGVMGRKNDIKYRLTASQIDELAALQKKILANVSSYVKPGGTLMFSTCTVSRRENHEGYDFIKNELGFEAVDFYDLLPNELKDESARDGFLQLYGKDGLSDGFFIAKFKRV